MRLEYVPLLRTARDIYAMPRNYARFQHYLRTIFSSGSEHDELWPLVAMNPMANDLVKSLLDRLLDIQADEIAACACTELERSLAAIPGDFKVALVVSDDLGGGWTNRYACEFELRFAKPKRSAPPAWAKQSWVTCLLWSSEPASVERVLNAVKTTVLRAAYVHEHGPARTLREMLRQEGEVLTKAGCAGPSLDNDDLSYTREIISPYLDEADMRTAIECLFGDEAARTLGFTPRGLSHWAGLALARHDRLAETGCNQRIVSGSRPFAPVPT